MTTRERKLLKKIANRLTIQSADHYHNIVEYYRIMDKAVRDQFTEDNKPTLDHFIEECQKSSLPCDKK